MLDNKVKKPVFIIGAGRSGTTLLFDLLANHPELAKTTGYPEGEDHEGWVKYGKCVMAGTGNPSHEKYGNGINGYQQCLHMTADDATPEIIDAMHAHYLNDILKGRSEKQILNKQPHLSNKLGYVLKIFPDAKFVHIIRDCEHMAASYMAIMDHLPNVMIYWPFDERNSCLWVMPRFADPEAEERLKRHPAFYPGGGRVMWADYWNKINVGILEQMEFRRDQLLTIRYEDLIAHADMIGKRIVQFCELSPFNFEFDHFESNTALKHLNRFDADTRASLVAHASPVRKLFGYEPDTGELAWSLYLP